jgi:hypothetical protein
VCLLRKRVCVEAETGRWSVGMSLGEGVDGGWGLFGAAAGVLYGLWVGRSTSPRRLRPIAPLLPQNPSSLVAWTNGPPDEATLAVLAGAAESARLILSFITTERGAVLALG